MAKIRLKVTNAGTWEAKEEEKLWEWKATTSWEEIEPNGAGKWKFVKALGRAPEGADEIVWPSGEKEGKKSRVFCVGGSSGGFNWIMEVGNESEIQIKNQTLTVKEQNTPIVFGAGFKMVTEGVGVGKMVFELKKESSVNVSIAITTMPELKITNGNSSITKWEENFTSSNLLILVGYGTHNMNGKTFSVAGMSFEGALSRTVEWGARAKVKLTGPGTSVVFEVGEKTVFSGEPELIEVTNTAEPTFPKIFRSKHEWSVNKLVLVGCPVRFEDTNVKIKIKNLEVAYTGTVGQYLETRTPIIAFEEFVTNSNGGKLLEMKQESPGRFELSKAQNTPVRGIFVNKVELTANKLYIEEGFGIEPKGEWVFLNPIRTIRRVSPSIATSQASIL